MKEKSWVIYGDSARQMFIWLTPYIEEAGYSWEVETQDDTVGKYKITIYKK